MCGTVKHSLNYILLYYATFIDIDIDIILLIIIKCKFE